MVAVDGTWERKTLLKMEFLAKDGTLKYPTLTITVLQMFFLKYRMQKTTAGMQAAKNLVRGATR